MGKLSMKDLMALFGRDAEHDHPVDPAAVEERIRVLDSSPRKAPIGAGPESRRAPEKKGSGSYRPEHPVYGRR